MLHREPETEAERERAKERERARESAIESARESQRGKARERQREREPERARLKKNFPRCPFLGVTLMSGETQPGIRCHSWRLSTTRREPSRFEEDLVLVF